MAISTYPAASGGGIKSVQRGSAGGAGNVTITAVDIAKSFVTVFGTASSGTVASSFTLSQNAQTVSSMFATSGGPNSPFWRHTSMSAASQNSQNDGFNAGGTWTPTVNAPNYTVSAGSNNLVSAVVQGFLANSTTLTVSGACRYEIVEFN